MTVKKPTSRAAINLSLIEFEGALEVIAPTVFLPSLLGGIGPGKGFGCGLMLIRRDIG
jgi:CRISPR system Cascade subunit CasE